MCRTWIPLHCSWCFSQHPVFGFINAFSPLWSSTDHSSDKETLFRANRNQTELITLGCASLCIPSSRSNRAEGHMERHGATWLTTLRNGKLAIFFSFGPCHPCGMQDHPQPRVKPVPLNWEHRVLTTGLPGKSESWHFKLWWHSDQYLFSIPCN